MHTLKKTFLTLALALAFVSAEAAQNTGRILIPESKLKFKANDDYTEVTITGCSLGQNDYRQANGKWLEIPSKIQGVPVTEIGEGAFNNGGDSSYNVGLWIPDGIKKLGKSSFSFSYFCAIRLPEGLKEIPGKEDYKFGCFYGCSAKSINIPTTVEYIGAKAFYECSLEEAVIPAGCTIETSAFENSKLKKLTFPKGRIYFEMYDECIGSKYCKISDYTYRIPFRDCKNLETIVIPKELDIFYSTYRDLRDSRGYYYATYITEKLTLSDFITGDKINASFALQKQLKAVNVRNRAEVESEENLALYNKAVAEKKWDQAKNIAQNTYNHFNDFQDSDHAEEWRSRITDVNCTQYFPALADKLKLDGTVEKMSGKIVYKIYLPKDDVHDWCFKLKDDSGKVVEEFHYREFLERFNKTTGYEYITMDYDSNIGRYYIYRSATEAELAAYNKNRKDAVKTFFDGIKGNENLVKDGNNLTFKINLPDESCKYDTHYVYYAKDAAGTNQEYTESEFLNLLKEISGYDYQCYGSSYIYRSLTEAELAAYNKNRKDAVKTFIDTITPSGSVVNDRDSICFDVKLPKGSYKSGTIYVNDASGKKQEFTESEFEKIVKEITGFDYEINYSPYRIRRNATEAETAAYNQNRKDAVKAFLDTITPNGSTVKSGNNLTFKINLPDESCKYDSYNRAYVYYAKDAAGKNQEFTESEFLGFVKEITGLEYEVSDRSSNPYIYRKATEAELAAYNKNRKDAVKTFINSITPTGSVVQAGGSICFDITFPEGSYKNGTIYVNDASGKKQEFTESEFLKLVKEITGFDYEIRYYTSTYVYFIRRNATEAETAAYNQNRKDAVKTFIEKLTQSGNVVKGGGNILIFEIALPEGSYSSYSNGTFYANDVSGKKQEFTKSEFLSLVKEITGFDYKTTKYNNGTYCIYRNATEAETAAYNQNRKDAVKTFIEKLTQSGNVVKSGNSLIFEIALPEGSYSSYNYGTFYVNDASGKKQEFTKSEFLSLVKEITGFAYKTAQYNNGTYYLYRAATEEEILNNKKHAMRTFFNGISADGKLVKNGKKNVYTIPLPDGSYSEKNNTFSMIDAAGNTLAIPESDFLAFTKEESTFTYYVGKIQDGTFCIFREPNREEKIGIAFNEGTLHTNLATIKFEDKNGVVTIKGFTEKKTAFENAGLKVKDEVKKITVKTKDGEEKEISLADLAGLHPVPTKTVTFTVERTEKKNVQTLTFSAAVEWNEKDLKKIK